MCRTKNVFSLHTGEAGGKHCKVYEIGGNFLLWFFSLSFRLSPWVLYATGAYWVRKQLSEARCGKKLFLAFFTRSLSIRYLFVCSLLFFIINGNPEHFHRPPFIARCILHFVLHYIMVCISPRFFTSLFCCCHDDVAQYTKYIRRGDDFHESGWSEKNGWKIDKVLLILSFSVFVESERCGVESVENFTLFLQSFRIFCRSVLIGQ